MEVIMKIKVNIHQPKQKFVCRPLDEKEYDIVLYKDLSYPVKKHSFRAQCDNYATADSKYRLYILKEAADLMLSFIEWDKHTERNHTEMVGFMIGHHYYDENKDIYYSEVESIFTIPTDISTEVYLQLSTDSMFAIEQMLDAYNLENDTDCKFIGWFHTHPNSLPVFMSSTDLITQTRFFADDLGYAIVLNPHKLCWKAFRSVKCYDTKCSIVNKNPSIDASTTQVNEQNPVPNEKLEDSSIESGNNLESKAITEE